VMARVLKGDISPYDSSGRTELLAAARQVLEHAARRMSKVPAARVIAAAHPERSAGGGGWKSAAALAPGAAADAASPLVVRSRGAAADSGGAGMAAQQQQQQQQHCKPQEQTSVADGVVHCAAPEPRHIRMALAELLGHKDFLAAVTKRAPSGQGGRAEFVRPVRVQCALNLFGLYFTLHALSLDPGELAANLVWGWSGTAS